jgi:ankyrin repeat protein
MTLQIAIELGNISEIKRLLSEGTDINADNHKAIRYACYINDLEVIKLLLENGANIDKARKWSKIWGRTELVDYLTKQMLIEKLNDITDSN